MSQGEDEKLTDDETLGGDAQGGLEDGRPAQPEQEDVDGGAQLPVAPYPQDDEAVEQQAQHSHLPSPQLLNILPAPPTDQGQ